MKFGLFIEEIWAKIAIETLIYFWKSILAVIKKLGAIWPLDHYITVGITSRPSDQHGRDLGSRITLHEEGGISPIFWQFTTD